MPGEDDLHLGRADLKQKYDVLSKWGVFAARQSVLGELAIRLQPPRKQHQSSSRRQPKAQHGMEGCHSCDNPQPGVARQGGLHQRGGIAAQDGPTPHIGPVSSGGSRGAQAALLLPQLRAACPSLRFQGLEGRGPGFGVTGGALGSRCVLHAPACFRHRAWALQLCVEAGAAWR